MNFFIKKQIFLLLIIGFTVYSQAPFEVVQRYTLPSNNQGWFIDFANLNDSMAILEFENISYLINCSDSSIIETDDTIPNKVQITFDTLNMKVTQTSDSVYWATTDRFLLRSEDKGNNWDTLSEIKDTVIGPWKDVYVMYGSFSFINDSHAYYIYSTIWYYGVVPSDGASIVVTNNKGQSWEYFSCLELNMKNIDFISQIPVYWYPRSGGENYNIMVEEWSSIVEDESKMFMSNEIYSYDDNDSLIKIFDYDESHYCKTKGLFQEGEIGDEVFSMKLSSPTRLWVVSRIADTTTSNDSIQILILEGDFPTNNSNTPSSLNRDHNHKIKFTQNRYLSFTAANGQFTLYSLQGKKLMNSKINNSKVIDLYKIPNGFYIANMKTAGHNISKRILINRR